MALIHENIRRLRKAKGMTQLDLAKAAGYRAKSSITKIESGDVDLAAGKIKTFADVLGVSPAELMGIEEDDSEGEMLLNLFHALPPDQRHAVLVIVKAMADK